MILERKNRTTKMTTMRTTTLMNRTTKMTTMRTTTLMLETKMVLMTMTMKKKIVIVMVQSLQVTIQMITVRERQMRSMKTESVDEIRLLMTKPKKNNNVETKTAKCSSTSEVYQCEC